MIRSCQLLSRRDKLDGTTTLPSPLRAELKELSTFDASEGTEVIRSQKQTAALRCLRHQARPLRSASVFEGSLADQHSCQSTF